MHPRPGRLLRLFCSLCLTLAGAAVYADGPEVRVQGEAGASSSPREVLEAFHQAFNAHDVDSMMDRVAEEIRWFQVEGDEVRVEASGKEALRQGMESYFQAVPSVRSTLEGLQVQGEFASFRVRVTWTHGATGEQRSQASLAVYQVVDGLIVRCWYYPASS